MPRYKIIRFYFSDDFANETVKRGLTLEQAQEHCNDPETSSETATLAEGTLRTARRGPWFEGYTQDDGDPVTETRPADGGYRSRLPDSLDLSNRYGGGDPLADYLFAKGEL